MNGKVVDIKRMAIHDGPGIRTTVFMKGCPLSCRWCHNPESISPKAEIGMIDKKCVLCGKCALVCPEGAHSFLNGGHQINRAKCTACGKCVEACLSGALEYYGREMTVAETVNLILADKAFYINSGGGATLSGGEPLLQADFCASVLDCLHEEKVHCAIDTCGAVPWDNFEAVLPLTDMFLYDIKHFDEEKHQEYTGMSNRIILDNLCRLSGCGIPIEIRIPVIPGFNTDRKTVKAVGEFLGGLQNISAVCLLPYHALSHSKYTAIGRPDTMPDEPEQWGDMLGDIARQLGGNGVKVLL